MINVSLGDGSGKGVCAKVCEEGLVHTMESIYPPTTPDKRKIFRQYLTTDGTASGSKPIVTGKH